jgi:uncharacterized membrane protein (UPF0127 family)
MNTKAKYENQKRAFFILCLLMVGIVAGAVFLQGKVRSSSLLRATFEGAQLTTPVYLTIVNTPRERERGLMYQTGLAEDEGMLFVFPKEQEHPFWMKNTPLSLDMIFLNAANEVVGVVTDAPPFSEEQQTVKKPSLYTIELRAGSAKRLGVREGNKVVFGGPVPLGVN